MPHIFDSMIHITCIDDLYAIHHEILELAVKTSLCICAVWYIDELYVPGQAYTVKNELYNSLVSALLIILDNNIIYTYSVDCMNVIWLAGSCDTSGY